MGAGPGQQRAEQGDDGGQREDAQREDGGPRSPVGAGGGGKERAREQERGQQLRARARRAGARRRSTNAANEAGEEAQRRSGRWARSQWVPKTLSNSGKVTLKFQSAMRVRS